MKKALLVLFIISSLLNAPLFSIRKGEKLILEELYKIQEILKSLDKKITIIETDFSAIEKKIEKMETRLSVMSKSQADENQSKENIVTNLGFLKEELNELKNKINAINDRLISTPPMAGGDNSVIDPTNPNNGANTPPTNVITQTPKNAYYIAYSDYLKKNYELAIEGFKQFLTQFPKNRLADNSLYWIGECYYSQKKYSEAVKIFSRLIVEYADGDKIPASILKKGYSLIEMGKEEEGIQVLKELNAKYPLSEEAALAQQRIKDLQE